MNVDPTPKTMTINVTHVNQSPLGTAKTVTTAKNTAYVFKVADFGFSDPHDSPANTLLTVKITTLPLLGSLTDNGVAVAVGAHISVADITAGKLKYTPKTGGTGTAYASFTFQVQDNGTTANGGIDTDPTPKDHDESDVIAARIKTAWHYQWNRRQNASGLMPPIGFRFAGVSCLFLSSPASREAATGQRPCRS